MQSASEMIKLANKVAHETESKEKAKEQSLVSGNFANNEVKVNPESQPVTEENKKAEEKIAHVESKYTLENTPTSPDPNEAEKVLFPLKLLVRKYYKNQEDFPLCECSNQIPE